jgi:gliding motility-associated-like protein
LNLNRTSFREISPLCATSISQSTCNGGALPGIQEHIYEGIYTLPQACTDWKFSYSLCCRNNAITTVTNPGSQNLFVEATLNNIAAPCNSSPDFSVNPVPYICRNQPFYYNQGASDVDGDSMVYTLIPSKHTTSNNVPYISPYSSANPIATASGFNFNSSTGQASFTPTTNQIGIVAVRVEEYRAGVLIGSTIRDMQVIVLNCVNQTPTISNPTNISGALYNPATRIFTVCAGNTMTFRVTSSDPDAAQTLTVLSNALASTPGSTLTHSGSNPIVSIYTWTPPTNLTGSNFSISFNASDGFCPIVANASIGFNIYVPRVSIKASDTIVCPGNSKNITLNATTVGANGTETYQWGPPVGFVSATNIKNPTVAVSQPTRYWVTMQQFGCTVRDTINIQPYATLVVNPDTVNFCIVDSPITLNAIFTKIDTNYKAPVTYSWTPAAGLLPSSTVSNPKVSPTVSTTYSVTAGDSICRLTRTARVNLVACVCRDTARIATPNLLTCGRLSDTLNATTSRFITSTTFQWIVSGGGNIVSGANTLKPVIDRPGTYKLVLSNSLTGCKDSTTVTVLQDIALPVVNAGADTTLTCTRTSLTLKANTAVVGATFVWSTGATTQNISVNTPNTYIVRITNPVTRCVGADTVVVTRDLTWPIVNAGVDTVLNCVRTSLTLNATSNIAGTTFAWSNGTIGVANTVSSPATYTVTATNPNTGCTASDAVVVTRNITVPTATVSMDSILTCTRTAFNLLASSNISNATFAWSNGSISALNAVSSPATYTVTATNPLNGCTVSAARVVTQNITTPTVSAGPDTVLNCAHTSLTLRATSNVGTATFAWSNAINTQNNTISTPNTYSVTATNPANGCTISDNVIVTQDITPISVDAGLDTMLNCVRTSLTLIATASSPATFVWSNGTTGANNTISSSGNYRVTATNLTNGCTASDLVFVNRNITTPGVGTTIDSVLTCTRTAFNIVALPNIPNATFQWSNGVTTAINNISSPGNYTVTITDDYNRCTASASRTVTQNIAIPTINAGVDTVLNCMRTSITLRATAIPSASTFVWSNGPISALNTVSSPASYTVTVTNPFNGCTVSATHTVTQDITIPTVNAGLDTVLNCVRTSLTLHATSNVGTATFAWSNAVNSQNNTISTPNTYSVTATNPTNSCTISDNVIVTQDITLPTVDAGLDTVLNCVRTSLTLQATANIANVSFAWSNGTNTASNTVSSPATYSVTATNSYNRCTISDAVVVSRDLTWPIINAGVDTVLNCVRTSLTLNATSNIAGTTFAWSNGTIGAVNTVSSPATYTVTATNPNTGCTASDAVVVSQDITPPTVNAGLDTILNCVRTDLNLIATSNITNASFAWSNGTITAINNVNTPNTYTVTITNDYNRCTVSDNVIVSQDITPPTVNAGLDTILNCVRTDLNLIATSNITNASFAWSNGTITAINNVTTPNTYTVTVTNDYNKCTVSDNVIVSQDITPPTVNAGLDSVLTCTRTSITLEATAIRASFAWSNGPITALNTISSPATYTVTATDTYNGCTASDDVVISQDITPPTVNAGLDSVLTCTRTSITLEATAIRTSFAWSNGPITALNTISSPATYSVTATDTYNGCTASDDVVISQDITPPTVNAGVDTILNCIRTSLTLQASANRASFAWSNGPITALNTISSPATYTVTATDTYNGCTASDDVIVSQDITAPVVNAGVDTILLCNRTSVQLEAFGVLSTFVWSNGSPSATNLVSSPGTYSVTATNIYNACTASDDVVVSQDITPPTVNAGLDSVLTCTRTSITLEATAIRASFAWSNGPITALNTISSPATYTVTATDTYNGCTASDDVVISQDITPPTVNAGLDSVLTCTRTSITLEATAIRTSFAWSNGPITALNTISSPATYSVTATDTYNGCTASDDVVISQDITPPTVNAGVDTILNCIRTSLTLQASANRASFAWSNGPITALNTISSPATYTVTATDTYNGCTASDDVIVSQDITAPVVNAGVDTILLCNRTSVQLEAFGVLSTFVWSNGSPSATNLVSSPGTYSVTATNIYNACTASDDVVVSQDITPPTVNAGLDSVLTCTRTSITLEATAIRASFAWSNGPITALNTISSPATYTVTATDTYNGCTASDDVVISQDITPPTVNAGLDSVLTCTRTSITLEATAIRTSFAWSNGPITALNTISSPATYSVTATDTYNGCTASDDVVISQDITPPTVNAGVDTILNCIRTSLTLQASANRASFAWSNGPITALNTISSPATYTVTATDTYNGCTASDDVIVSQDITAPVVNAGVDTVLNCVRTSLTLQATANITNVSFTWSNGSLTDLNTVSTAGIYTITATNTYNGCTAADFTTVIADTISASINAGQDTLLSCTHPSISLNATTSNPSVSYAWSTGSNTATTMVSTGGTYYVTVTLHSNGCSAIDNVTIGYDTIKPIINAGPDTLLTCRVRNINWAATSNVANSSFIWNNGVVGAANRATSPSMFSLIVTNNDNGCSSRDTMFIAQNITPPNANAGRDTSLTCVRTQLLLAGNSSTPNVSYNWSTGTSGLMTMVTSPGNKTLTVTDNFNGCTASDIVNVRMDTLAPSIDAGPDKIVNCIKTNETFTATAFPPTVLLKWSNDDVTNSINVSLPIQYSVTATDPANGCTASDFVTLIPDTATPIVNAGLDQELTCSVQTVSFNATINASPASFIWSNGDTLAFIQTSTAGLYTVSATNLSNGCVGTDQVVAIQIAPPTITYDVRENPCPEMSKGHIIPIVNGGKAPYTFTWNNGSTDPFQLGKKEGNFAVTITDANGCVKSDSFTLTQQYFNITINGVNEVELGNETTLNVSATGASGLESYQWSPDMFLSCTDCVNPTVAAMNSITYNVVATDTNGCKANASHLLTVTPRYDLYVPNAFTPNNDGNNDQYEIFGNKKIWSHLEFSIFNRIGEMVFQTSDHEFKWDGSYMGEMMPNGIYVYQMKLSYVNGHVETTQKGSISLIR